MESGEVWRSVPEYEGLYEVSDLGRVRSLDRTRLDKHGRAFTLRGVLKKAPLRKGSLYRMVVLSRDGKPKAKLVHRLVLSAFVGPCPDGMEGCHNNGDPGDNTLSNLRWDTRSANMQDKHKHGTSIAKLTVDEVTQIKTLLGQGKMTQTAIAKKFGLNDTRVSNIKRGKSWGWLRVAGVPTTHPSSRKGSNHYKASLNEDSVKEIKRLLAEGAILQKDIATKFGVHQNSICDIKHGRTWGHVKVGD